MIQFSSKKCFLRVLTGALLLSGLTGCGLIEVHIPSDTESTASEKVTEALPPETAASTEKMTETAEKNPGLPPVTSEEKAKKALGELRKANLDGMNFIIAFQANGAAFGEDENGTILRSDALSAIRNERMSWAEEAYNAHILTFSYAPDALYQEIKNAYHSDTQFVADFYAIPADEIGRYQAEGLLLNLNSLPFTDYNKPYFDRAAMRQLNAGYSVLGAVGDFTYAPENAYGIYFNRDLAKQLEISSPYQAVKDGTWTYDTFFSLSKTAQSDPSGLIYGDNLGALGAERAEAALLASAELHMAQTAFGRSPTLQADVDAVCSLADLLYANVTKSTTIPPKNAYTEEIPDAEAMFEAGKLLFFCGPLSNMYRWADIPVSWGIVPMPKLHEEQSRYSTYIGDASVLCVPSVTGVPESAGLILQALFAASYDAYEDAFLDEALTLYVRDGKTIDMLDMIDDRFFYDFSQMTASGYRPFSAATIGALHQTQISRYTFDTLYQQNKKAAEKEMRRAFPVFEG